LITILIQGPTKYYTNILDNIFNLKYNIIWSTFEDEPQENIKQISKNCELILNPKPVINGYGNINLQTQSTINGIKKTKDDLILKIRSDIIVSDYNRLIQILLSDTEKLWFLAWSDSEIPYPVDYISFGNRQEMSIFWDFFSVNNYSFAEKQLLDNYCFKKSIKIINLGSIFNYFLKQINNQDIELKWLKNNIILNNYIYDKFLKG